MQIDLTPVEVAAKCRHLPGLVFFDSALEIDGAISIVAAAPAELFTGTEWAALARKVAARQRTGFDHGLPVGMAAGHVDYDGVFTFGFYEDMLIFRHADHTWHECGRLAERLRDSGPTAKDAGPSFTPEIARADFCEMVRTAQEYVSAGDIYQVNLSQRFSAKWSGDPWAFYQSLRDYSPAPHAAYLEMGGRMILSSSPEMFLRMSGREIVTRPIKGTRPRRHDPALDEKSAYDLITSAKEIAELIMITDLERNDLGQVCEYGTVCARDLLRIERYPHVFHMVSTIAGRLRESVDHVTALQHCFPGGSITGAPKHRARQVIAELEPAPRGVYTGAIGYFGYNGESQFSIAIRTVICEAGTAHFHVGAGIVADSQPEQEYQETLDKAAGILLAATRME